MGSNWYQYLKFGCYNLEVQGLNFKFNSPEFAKKYDAFQTPHKKTKPFLAKLFFSPSFVAEKIGKGMWFNIL